MATSECVAEPGAAEPRAASPSPAGTRPMRFLATYARRRPIGHLTVVLAVLVAVICSVSTQYGLKHLIDIVSHGPSAGAPVWGAFALLCGLIAADNLTWRIAGWSAAYTFVAVTGDIRRDLFAHLAGHSPSYFSERLPGALASRITATANAVYAVENTGSWNVLPPCVAVVCAIVFIGAVHPVDGGGAGRAVIGAGRADLLSGAARQCAAHELATRAAAVDGELVDVIGNMHVVRAFGATFRERGRIADTIEAELKARRGSLLYLEKLRLTHAVLTALLSAGVVAWGDCAVAARAGQRRRPGADHRAIVHHPALDPRPCRGAGRPDPARGAAGRSDRCPVDAARVAGPAGCAVAGSGCRQGDVRGCGLCLSWPPGGAAGFRPDDQAGGARRPGGVLGCRQVHRAGVVAAVLRCWKPAGS